MRQQLSKLLSYWLRHAPETANLTLDREGWAYVAAVQVAIRDKGLDPMILESVVLQSEKQRFEVSLDGKKIRARQGHSVKVEIDWPATKPPARLYHGTIERFMPSILEQGLRPIQRHHVHLSPDIETARQVGARRGNPVILEVAAELLAREGAIFRLSSNGVWLADAVPPHFLVRVPE